MVCNFIVVVYRHTKSLLLHSIWFHYIIHVQEVILKVRNLFVSWAEDYLSRILVIMRFTTKQSKATIQFSRTLHLNSASEESGCPEIETKSIEIIKLRWHEWENCIQKQNFMMIEHPYFSLRRYLVCTYWCSNDCLSRPASYVRDGFPKLKPFLRRVRLEQNPNPLQNLEKTAIRVFCFLAANLASSAQ